MQPATKRVRIEEPKTTINAQLKPSQVTASSNIFGSLKDDDEEEGSEEDIEESEDEIDEGEEQGAEDDDDESEEDAEDHLTGKKKKNDPQDFALAMQKILGSGLTATTRKNPILARSLEAKKLDEATLEEKLEQKVRRQLLAEKKQVLDRAHNANVLGQTEEETVQRIEKERQLRKISQRGVVRLFNAIRAAQIAAGDVRQGAGVKVREAKAQEMSQSSFLNLIKAGGRSNKKMEDDL